MGGWALGSSVPERYVHQTYKDVETKMLKKAGIVVEEAEKQQESLKPKGCLWCKESNSPIAVYCSRCARPLDAKVAMEMEKQRERMDSMMNSITEDPEVVKFIVGKIMEKGVIH